MSAKALIRLCATLLPAERGQWGAAMQAEMDTIEDDRPAMAFALGCLWTSAKERVQTPDFVIRTVRYGVLVVMLTLAIIAAAMAIDTTTVSLAFAAAFVLSSAIFAGAAFVYRAKGPGSLIRLAITIIPLYVTALGFVRLSGAMSGHGEQVRFYSALAIEGVFIWTSFLVVAVVLSRLEPPSDTRRNMK